MSEEKKNKKKKQFKGIVVSDKMQKTIVVLVERIRQHPLYKKYYKYRKKFMAHDEKEMAKIGDEVLIEECRPISKRKHFRLIKILTKSNQNDS